MDLNLSFEIQNGLNITETGVSVFSGTAAPNVEVYDGTAASGTLYLQTNGDAYLKTSSDWVKILTGQVSISLSTSSAGLTIGGSPTGQNGTLTINLAGDLAAVESLSLTGLAARTGTNTWATREILGTAGQISVSNGTGVSGNPQISLSSSGVIPGTYGGALTVPVLTVDMYGRITSASSSDINIPLNSLSNVSLTSPSVNQVLQFNGTNWVNATISGISSDHGLLSGLNDDDHTQYVHNFTARTISAVHTFNPSTPSSPFILGANSTGQLISGLNADTVDGIHASGFQPINADLTAIAALATTGIVRRTASNTWSAGGSISLTTEVTGTLSIANGGTGQTTRQAAFNALAGTPFTGAYLRGDGTNWLPSNINLLETFGSLPPNRLNGGLNANSLTFWRGDGTWSTPTFGANAQFGTLFSDVALVQLTDTTTDGIQVAFSRTFSTPVNITVDTVNDTWTHAIAGWYRLTLTFRHGSGGDVWRMFAVTKNGNTNVVGASVRAAVGGSAVWQISFLYLVDSTTANYRLMGWSQGDTFAGFGAVPGGISPTLWSSTDVTIQSGVNYGASLLISVIKVS